MYVISLSNLVRCLLGCGRCPDPRRGSDTVGRTVDPRSFGATPKNRYAHHRARRYERSPWPRWADEELIVLEQSGRWHAGRGLTTMPLLPAVFDGVQRIYAWRIRAPRLSGAQRTRLPLLPG